MRLLEVQEDEALLDKLLILSHDLISASSVSKVVFTLLILPNVVLLV